MPSHTGRLLSGMRYNQNPGCVISGETSANNSAFALFDEPDDFGDFFCLRQFFLHGFNRLPRVVFRAVNQAERFFDQLDIFVWIIFSLQADQIDPANLGGVAVRDHEWGDVLDNFRAAAGDGEASDPAKLMHGGEAAHYGIVSHLNVAGQCAVIRENDTVANGAIVSDMTVREKISGVADPRFALARCAPIYSNEFAKRVLVADFQIRKF